MARVLIRTQAWGVVTSRAGDALASLTFAVKNTDGSAATHWSAETGGTSSTATLTTDTLGGATLSGADRWIEAGEYDVTTNGTTYRVNTNGVPSWVAVAHEAPLNPLWPEYGAKFDGTTDDTAAWTAMFAALPANGGEIYVPPVGTSLVTQVVVPINSTDVVIRGGGSRNNQASCRLLSHYAGSGAVFAAQAAAGLRIEGLSITNDNASFTGKLLDISRGAGSKDTTQWSIRNLRLTAVTQAGSSVRLLQLTKVTAGAAEGVYFNGGGYGVEGLTAGGDYCNSNTVGDGCYFASQDTIAIHNLGAACRVQGATFEPLRAGGPGAYLQDATLPGQALSFYGNWTGDGSGATGNWFTVCGTGIAFLGGMIVSGAAGSKGIVTNGNCSGLTVLGIMFTSLTNALDPTTGTHDHIVFFGNSIASVTTAVPTGLTNLGTGSIVQDAGGTVTRFTGDIVVDNTAATQVRVGNSGGASASIFFGTAEDTNVNRSAASTLRSPQSLSAKLVKTDLVAPTYSSSITLDASLGEWQTITVTNGTAFTMFQPSNAPASAKQELTVEIFNNSGGAMGAISWSGAFVFAGFTWANPASTKKRYVRFEYNGSSWIATSMSSADY